MAKLGGHPGPLSPSCSPTWSHTGDPESSSQRRSPQSLNCSPRSPLCGSIRIPITIHAEPQTTPHKEGLPYCAATITVLKPSLTRPHAASLPLRGSPTSFPPPSSSIGPPCVCTLATCTPLHGPCPKQFATMPPSSPANTPWPETNTHTYMHLHPPEHCTQPGLTQPVQSSTRLPWTLETSSPHMALDKDPEKA